MEPRHLRGLEVGCGKHKQCVWLPMPHFKEAWCSGVDFLYSIDYEGMLDAGEVDRHAEIVTVPSSDLSLSTDPASSIGLVQSATSPEVHASARVLRLEASSPERDPLEWLELSSFAGTWAHRRGRRRRRREPEHGWNA